MLMASTKLQNKSFLVMEITRKAAKCQKMKIARAKRAKVLFFIVKYANLSYFCRRRLRGCLTSLSSLSLGTTSKHEQVTSSLKMLLDRTRKILP